MIPFKDLGAQSADLTIYLDQAGSVLQLCGNWMFDAV